MSKSDPKRAAELGALLARHYPEASIHCVGLAVREMQGAARTAVAWEVKRCNVPMSEVQEIAGSTRLVRLQQRINTILAYAPLHLMPAESGAVAHDNPAWIKLGGDPRGACARLIVPGLDGDGLGDGFAIY